MNFHTFFVKNPARGHEVEKHYLFNYVVLPVLSFVLLVFGGPAWRLMHVYVPPRHYTVDPRLLPSGKKSL